MKRCIMTCFLMMTLLPGSSYLWSQEFETGNKISVKVNAQVRRDSLGLMQYDYDVISLPESQQNIWNFMVIIKFHPDSIYKAFRIHNWWGPDMPDPDNDKRSWVSWSAPDNRDIRPGNSMSGFGFITRFLPGITDFYAEGDHPVPSFEEGMAPDSLPGYDDLTPYGPGIVGKTVGPVLPPTVFSSTAFVDTLISYKHQAFSFGWIDNQGILNSLDQKLENTRKELRKGKKQTAINELRAFLNEVEVQKDKHLTSEAYALLKFNAEYLIQKLEEK